MTGENQHLGQFDISVLPECPRQGLGRKFLGLIASSAQEEKRRLLISSTVDRLPGGEAFMKRIGAQKGLEAPTNQLRLNELDRNLLTAWLERGRANLSEFELGLWEGPYPDEQLNEITNLWDLVNQQPFGELEIEDMHRSPEQLLQMEKNMFARGYQRWTLYITDRATKGLHIAPALQIILEQRISLWCDIELKAPNFRP